MSNVQIRGICQCCGRQQAVVGSTMSKHGYKVEYGFFNGVCPGDKHKPVEKDRTVLDATVAYVTKECDEIEVNVAKMKAGKAHPQRCRVSDRAIDRDKFVAWEDANEWQRKSSLERAIYASESRIRAGREFCRDMLRIADEYHGKELVEVAKKEAPVAINVGDTKQGAKRKLTAYRIDGARVYWKDEAGFKSWTGSRAWRALPDAQD
ncbi:hypothetical protein [Burkholderia phage BCSR52]|uniref:Uncharacterized protein n=1 Tax=Burkholderia phage BCSR52 TaxID=2805748 RepID=A0A889IR98_9CAUD|nr:hypothetical protein [Burkholderia phage BCSR52]